MKAKPGAKTAFIKKIGPVGLFDGGREPYFLVAVKERAVEGKANRAIEKAVAEYFKTSVSRVRIVRGQSAREKVIEVDV
ncbi:MAG: DUF167 domain-containing protein [Patescibacteria group bacterium]|nr:DUF167 domain-containing protein [Patescibacteria group bacterium]